MARHSIQKNSERPDSQSPTVAEPIVDIRTCRYEPQHSRSKVYETSRLARRPRITCHGWKRRPRFHRYGTSDLRPARRLSAAPLLGATTHGETLELSPSGPWTVAHGSGARRPLRCCLAKAGGNKESQDRYDRRAGAGHARGVAVRKNVAQSPGFRSQRYRCRRSRPICGFDRRRQASQPPQACQHSGAKSGA